jgi:hypothetical protein
MAGYTIRVVFVLNPRLEGCKGFEAKTLVAAIPEGQTCSLHAPSSVGKQIGVYI